MTELNASFQNELASRLEQVRVESIGEPPNIVPASNPTLVLRLQKAEASTPAVRKGSVVSSRNEPDTAMVRTPLGRPPENDSLTGCVASPQAPVEVQRTADTSIPERARPPKPARRRGFAPAMGKPAPAM